MKIAFIFLSLSVIFFWRQRNQKQASSLKRTDISFWFIIICQSLLLAFFVGSSIWKWMKLLPQRYTGLISGYIGFSQETKTADLFGLYSTVVVFVITVLILERFYFKTFQERGNAKRDVKKILIVALLPFFILMGQSLRVSEVNRLLIVSTASMVLSLMLVLVIHHLLNHSIISSERTLQIGAKLGAGILFLFFSDLGIKVFFSRIKILNYPRGILVVAIIVLCFIWIIKSFSKLRGDFEYYLDLFLVFSQLGLPLLFCVFASPPVRLIDGRITIFHYNGIFYVLLFLLILISYVSVFVRFKQINRNQTLDVEKFISPLIFLAILIYLHSAPIDWPGISGDDYHAGEFYLPWWLFSQYGYLPFWDYQPARGLANYVPGFLSWLFYDNTFSGQSLIVLHHKALYIFPAFFFLRPILGDFIAFFALASIFSFAGTPLGAGVMVVSFLALIIKVSAKWHPLKAFWFWIGLSGLSALFMVAEGSMFGLATLPLGIYLFCQSYRISKRQVFVSLLGLLSLSLVLVLVTDLEQMIIGAIRYLLEQAGINDVAHGLPWIMPQDLERAVTSGFSWQIIRFSWLLLIIPAIYFLMNYSKRERHDRADTIQWFFLIAVFILCVLMIPRAAGRIDPSAYSRPGLISVGLVILVLPLFYQLKKLSSSKRLWFMLMLSVIYGLLGSQEVALSSIWRLDKYIISQPSFTITGVDHNLSNIGSEVFIDPSQLRRQTNIHAVLNQLLELDETYYDATNHSSDYGFQGKPSPVADVAFYNAPSKAQQIRIISNLEQKEVPLILVGSHNLLHDGGPLALRSFFVYEYLVNNFLPFEDEYGQVWMIKKGEEDRLDSTEYSVDGKEEQLNLLEDVFRQDNLAGLPASWGNSLDSLQKELSNPIDLMKNLEDLRPFGMELDEELNWCFDESGYMTLQMPEQASGDVLLLSFEDKLVDEGTIKLFWANELIPEFNENHKFLFDANSSVFLIPVSSSPSWAISDRIREIRVEFPDEFRGCFHINEVVLYSRAVQND